MDEKTADEEENPADGGEDGDSTEDKILVGIAAISLADLETERIQVGLLLDLAFKVYETGQESKFECLRQVLSDSQFQNEKRIMFTEHSDKLEFLVRRLEGIGYSGQVLKYMVG